MLFGSLRSEAQAGFWVAAVAAGFGPNFLAEPQRPAREQRKESLLRNGFGVGVQGFRALVGWACGFEGLHRAQSLPMYTRACSFGRV